MEKLIYAMLILHVISGGTALLMGGVAIFSKKGGGLHKKTGKVYFWAMTLVFITGIFIAGYRWNKFLFLIAFLSYYSVFSGIRATQLKHLHLDQSARWYDWLAGSLNAAANVTFLGLGMYFGLVKNNFNGAALSIGFSLIGLWITYTNMRPFLIKPKKHYEWYLSHIGNMMGGYIATTTAFFSTVVTRLEFMNPYLAFALPSLIGVPLLIYWTRKVERQFRH